MSALDAVRIARRELRGGLAGFRAFLACLALGVAAIAAVGSARESIELGLRREGAVILGGDAEIQLSYRFAENEEREWMESVAEDVSEIVDFRSMAVAGDGDAAERGLTQVKAVDESYPLYGSVALDPRMPLAEALDGANGLPGAVMDPVLADRLELALGDVFRLGAREFALMALLTREPDGIGGGFGLGPRTLVRSEALSDSGLLDPGTLFETAYRLKLPAGTDLAAAETAAGLALEGSGIRWRDSRAGAPGIGDFVQRLGAFLVLVGLAGLAVGGVGISAAVRAYIDSKTAVIATLKTLGAETCTIFLAYAFQIAALTALGILLGLALGAAVPLAFSPLIESRLPLPAVFGIHVAPLAEAAVYGALAAALFALWPLARSESVRAAELFRDAAAPRRALPRLPYVLASAALFAALVGLAARLSGLPALTLWAAAGLIASFLVLISVAEAVRRLARQGARARVLRGMSALRMALGSVGGPSSEAGPVVLSLGLGLTVLAAVGQIDWNLRSAIAGDLPEVAPSYFVVDIQNDQLPEFLERAAADPEVSNVETAPMLRGVITGINGLPASEVAGDHWVLEGDRGVTYSAALPEGATLTRGEWWPEDYDGPPLVSFAEEEGVEMGLEIGDEIVVNILGRDFAAEIASFREVDFSTAGIGFVMSMNPSALQGAPHTHIATIYAEPEAEGRLLREIGDAYPNVTLIRVRDAIARISEVLSGIAAATTYGAMATLATGLVVLIGAAAAGERARTYEAAVLKTLGAARLFVLANFALRSALFGLAAGAVAVAAGGVAGWGVMRFVMETDFRFEPVSAVAIVAGGVLTTMLAGLGFAWRPLAARPARVLRASE